MNSNYYNEILDFLFESHKQNIDDSIFLKLYIGVPIL